MMISPFGVEISWLAPKAMPAMIIVAASHNPVFNVLRIRVSYQNEGDDVGAGHAIHTQF